jgi:simple sugar transport system permease protein
MNLFRSTVIWPLAALAALLLFNAAASPGFFQLEWKDGRLFGTLVDIVNQSARVPMLLALGMTLVIATGGVDLSVGSLMAVSGAVAAMQVNRGAPLVSAVGLALLATTVLGLLNGVLVAKVRLQPIIATLVTMVAGRGLAMLLTGSQMVPFQHKGLQWLANGAMLGLPVPVLLVPLLAVLAGLALRRTAAALFVEATGDNETASRFAGIRTDSVRMAVYVFSGFCAGLSGILEASNIAAADPARIGDTRELDAIFAVVAGGTALAGGRFSLAGSIVGALLLQTLTLTLYNQNVPPAVAPVPKAIVILAVCLLHSPRVRAALARRTANAAKA